jgi:protocatechuate 3,4-dioxygenase beta subunit
MTDDLPLLMSRRDLLAGTAAVPVVLLLAACGDDGEEGVRRSTATSAAGDTGTDGRRELSPTPACDDGDDPTPEQTEGPFYAPETPRRTSLLGDGVRGERLDLSGVVLDTGCRPIAGALLDFWQADAEGEYDNEGYRLRGHQFADRRGRFRLATIVPGLYTGRTRHIHVKVQRRRGDVLTTQLYFPGEPANRTDGIFDEALLMDVRRAASRRRASFTFVLA